MRYYRQPPQAGSQQHGRNHSEFSQISSRGCKSETMKMGVMDCKRQRGRSILAFWRSSFRPMSCGLIPTTKAVQWQQWWLLGVHIWPNFAGLCDPSQGTPLHGLANVSPYLLRNYLSHLSIINLNRSIVLAVQCPWRLAC